MAPIAFTLTADHNAPSGPVWTDTSFEFLYIETNKQLEQCRVNHQTYVESSGAANQADLDERLAEARGDGARSACAAGGAPSA